MFQEINLRDWILSKDELAIFKDIDGNLFDRRELLKMLGPTQFVLAVADRGKTCHLIFNERQISKPLYTVMTLEEINSPNQP